MTNVPPHWQAHTARGYEQKMATRCTSLMSEILACATFREHILTDPRIVHTDLFAEFTPPGYPEYAGTYRGTLDTTLVARRASVASQFNHGQTYDLVEPAEVERRMNRLLVNIRKTVAQSSLDDYGKLLALTYAFCWFGKIHPFLDGNGHVQRALFAVCAAEFGIPLSGRFAIHPRPYDRLLAVALELFACAPQGKENDELPLIAEYLGFFLAGPYDAPRKHVPIESVE